MDWNVQWVFTVDAVVHCPGPGHPSPQMPGVLATGDAQQSLFQELTTEDFLAQSYTTSTAIHIQWPVMQGFKKTAVLTSTLDNPNGPL